MHSQIVDEIGLPRGVFNLVLGRGETDGQDWRVTQRSQWSSDGSVSAGEKIMATAAKTSPKCAWNWGVTGYRNGRCPNVNWQSKPSLIHASLIVGKCNCAERVYVQKSI
ncbi:aldehyde dehydrogenase family protein [Shigella sonnei]